MRNELVLIQDDAISFEENWSAIMPYEMYETIYHFSLPQDLYNSLPIEVKDFFYRQGNSCLYWWKNSLEPVKLKLSAEYFNLFNELMWNQIGHS